MVKIPTNPPANSEFGFNWHRFVTSWLRVISLLSKKPGSLHLFFPKFVSKGFNRFLRMVRGNGDAQAGGALRDGGETDGGREEAFFPQRGGGGERGSVFPQDVGMIALALFSRRLAMFSNRVLRSVFPSSERMIPRAASAAWASAGGGAVV